MDCARKGCAPVADASVKICISYMTFDKPSSVRQNAVRRKRAALGFLCSVHWHESVMVGDTPAGGCFAQE